MGANDPARYGAGPLARAGLTLDEWLEPDALLRARIYDRRRDATY